jgi:hypothetical protein
MAKLVFAVLCQDAIIEEESQILTLFRIIERVNVINVERMAEETPEFIPHPMKLVGLWHRSDPNKGEVTTLRYSMVDPSGKRADGGTMEIDLRENNSLRSIGRIRGFPNRGFGIYRFEVSQSQDGKHWKRAGSYPLQFGPLEEWEKARAGEG